MTSSHPQTVSDTTDFRVALSNCEREPIHVPGRVQDFGALFAIDLDDERLTHRSSNLAELLGLGSMALDRSVTLGAMLGKRATHELRNVAGLETLSVQRERLGQQRVNDRWLDVAACRVGERLVVECEPARSRRRGGSMLTRARQVLATLSHVDGVDGLLEQAVRCVRDLTGHDRVMAYRFLENGDGEVVAEARGNGTDAFLGLRYPAYDIPPQVRRIALQNPLRLIADIRTDPLELIDLVGGEPLDLTLTQLRGVSPVHVEYLENMGVRATLTLSLVVRGELWGLIACHHHRPLHPSPDSRSLCELFSQFLSLELQQRIEEELLQARRRADAARQQLVRQEGGGDQLADVFEALTTILPSLIAHDGLALIERGRTLVSGNTLPEPQLHELVELVEGPVDIVPLESLIALADRDDAWRQAVESAEPMLGGALVLRFTDEVDAWLVLFRNEIMSEVRWGGMPDKSLTYGPNGPRLHPRGSFDEYRQSVRGRCSPWSVEDEAMLSHFRLVLLETVLRQRMQGDGERERRRRQGDLLIAELNHRVKNILALVQSVTRQTQDESLSVEQYASALERRIAALASAHEVIGANGLQWAELEPMLLRDLRPFAHEADARIELVGERSYLRGDIAPIVGLVFHEMATNSAKHGALSVPTGRIGVTWFAEADGLSIAWREQGGPRVRTPSRTGFGRSLIEGAIAYECEGESRIRFLPTGVEIDLWLPAKAVSVAGDAFEAAPRATEPAHAPAVPVPTAAPSEPNDPADERSGRVVGALSRTERALVIEDNLLIVNDQRRLLSALGYREVDAAPSVRRALELIESERYDVALVDVNLREESSFAAAEALRERAVPIVFCTGYDVASALPEAFRGTPILSKPLTRDVLARTLTDLVASSEGEKG